MGQYGIYTLGDGAASGHDPQLRQPGVACPRTVKPHLVRTFKLSNDTRFEEKLRDMVGLYLDPPHNAAVFSFDDKGQIQALDRTQRGLPMKKGRCETMTHDYKRHATTTLFGTLNIATAAAIGKTYRKHQHHEVLRFLREMQKIVPKEQGIPIVPDHYATHKHEKVPAWIERKKRIFLHFIPINSSWANLVERFFAMLTHKQVRRGVFTPGASIGEVFVQFLLSYIQRCEWSIQTVRRMYDSVGGKELKSIPPW